MGEMLSLLDYLLTNARHLIELNQPQPALAALRRLIATADLPGSIAAEVHYLFGSLQLKLGNYRTARKHLRAGLRLDPTNAQALYELARAIESDPKVDAGRAGRYYARALELAPNQPHFLADAGAYHVQMGRVRKGLALLERAVELAADDPAILKTQIETLCELERFADALRAIRVARFRLRDESTLMGIENEIAERQIRHEQRTAPRTPVSSDESVILPFLGVVGGATSRTNENTKYRHDGITKMPTNRPHFLRRMDHGRSG